MITFPRDILYDLNGFASSHTINSIPVVCVVGPEVEAYSELDGTWTQMFEVVVDKAAFTPAPVKGKKLTFDGASQTIEKVTDDGQDYTIALSFPRVGEMVDQI